MQTNTQITRGQRWSSNVLGLLISASLMLSSIAAVPLSRQAQEPSSVPGSSQPAVSAAPSPITERVNYHQIVIRLKASTGVQANALPAALNGLNVTQMFTDAARLAPQKGVSVQAASGVLDRLSRYLQVKLDPATTLEVSQKLVETLRADPTVEGVYMEPVYLPAYLPIQRPNADVTPSFVGNQGYLKDQAAGPNGIDALYAQTIAGGLGGNVQLIDVEAGWRIGHEDLNISNSSLIESVNSSDPTWLDHGTAVLGIVAGRKNAYGVTGIAPDTYVRMVSTLSFNMADAIIKAAVNLVPGDVLLIPVQAIGPVSNTTPPGACSSSPTFESIPVEYWDANYDAIRAVTDAGIIVVEAAGTGSMNLDANIYGNRFNRNSRDSGAILTGAGDSATRAPLCESNYGARIDVQGWGNNVVTTGYGDLFQGLDVDNNPDLNRTYTAAFGGTSAASAMIAGAASSLQGVAKARGYLLTPSQMRSILRSTGTDQGGDKILNQIGPLPNLRKAIETKLPAGVLLLTPVNFDEVWTLRPTLDWQDFLNATQYELQISLNSGFTQVVADVTTTASEYTSPTNLTADTTYYWRVRPFVVDTWLNWPASYYFQFTVQGKSAPAITPVAPVSGKLLNTYLPTFTWKRSTSPQVTGYQLELSTNFDFSSPIDIDTPQLDSGTYITQVPPNPLAADTRYYWHVRSYITNNGQTYYGPWTSRWVLYTSINTAGFEPTISNPNLNMVDADTLRPTFVWGDVAGARAYWLQVSTSPSFVYTAIVLSTTILLPKGEAVVPAQYTMGKDLPRGKHLYWRVFARGTYGWSNPSSSIQQFDVAQPPYPVVLKSPADGAVIGSWILSKLNVTFSWYRPTTGPVVSDTGSFQIQVSDYRDFRNILTDRLVDNDPSTTLQSTLVTSDDVSFLPDKLYFWRVRAIGDLGKGNWSVVRSIKVTPDVPGNLNVDLIDTLRPTLSWTNVDMARSYQVQIARDSDLILDKTKVFVTGRIVATMTTFSSPPFVVTATLPRNAALQWRVRSGGVYGYSDWSDPVPMVTGNPPLPPVLSSPGDGSYLSTFGPTLSWYASVKITGNPDANAVSYELEVSSSLTNWTESLDLTQRFYQKFTGTDTLQKLPVDLLPKAGTYYWRVRASNANGEFSIWSPIRRFTTPAMVSGLVLDGLQAVDTPIGNATLQITDRAIQTQTNGNGEYQLRGLMPGNYTVTASTPGFGRQWVNFNVGYGTNLTRDFRLVSFPDDTKIRLVVYWNGSPDELDAHLWLPLTNPGHIYKDFPGDVTGTYRAEVTHSESNGFGPDVVTIDKNLFGGRYLFAVYMNASPDYFVKTGAYVAVYEGSTLKATYTVPASGSGHWWRVLSLWLENGVIRYTPSSDSFITDLQPLPNYPPNP